MRAKFERGAENTFKWYRKKILSDGIENSLKMALFVEGWLKGKQKVTSFFRQGMQFLRDRESFSMLRVRLKGK